MQQTKCKVLESVTGFIHLLSLYLFSTISIVSLFPNIANLGNQIIHAATMKGQRFRIKEDLVIDFISAKILRHTLTAAQEMHWIAELSLYQQSTFLVITLE